MLVYVLFELNIILIGDGNDDNEDNEKDGEEGMKDVFYDLHFFH
jgi:hypothetical protein